MKARQIKQRHIVLMKRHAFKRRCERFKAASRLRREQAQQARDTTEMPVEGEFVWEEN